MFVNKFWSYKGTGHLSIINNNNNNNEKHGYGDKYIKEDIFGYQGTFETHKPMSVRSQLSK